MRTVGSFSAGEAVVSQTNHSALPRVQCRALAQPQHYYVTRNLGVHRDNFHFTANINMTTIRTIVSLFCYLFHYPLCFRNKTAISYCSKIKPQQLLDYLLRFIQIYILNHRRTTTNVSVM